MLNHKGVRLSLIFLATGVISTPTFSSQDTVRFHGPSSISSESVNNIHISFADTVEESHVQIVYGDCEIENKDHGHHEISSLVLKRDALPDRLVWITPQDIEDGGCLHAFSETRRLGRSGPISLTVSRRKREALDEVGDSNGAWFDGVKYLEGKNQSETVTEEAKKKKIAIVGGGMAGLMTSLLLSSVGMHNWHITESSQRVGGRVRTKYLDDTSPDDYQYQEMGPMRFPVSVSYADTDEELDIQDHKMVFQLADVLNKMNKNNTDLAVKFIPWIQSSPNVPANSRGFRLPNGRIPTRAQLSANPSYANPAPLPENAEGVELAHDSLDTLIDLSPERMRNISANIFKAHREAIDKGLFHWSETTYLRYLLELDDDTVDFVSGSGNSPLWGSWYDSVYFAATTWKTIDKGLESLPRAFVPHVKCKTTYGRKIDGLLYDNETSKVSLTWRDDPFDSTPQTEEYDYAVVTVPFSKVRLWRTPQYSSLLSRAISSLNYAQSCKVALHYKTRFWESQEYPIYGGCGSTDIPGVGNVCYPAYKINSTGPGVILASYASGVSARSVASLSEEDHVALIQRAMVEVHGDIANEQFTGKYDRQCWEVDEHQAGAWASPTIGQQELFIPAYHKTEFNTIFVGEHTSITHAWIFSALESAVRGTTQLLLDLGLVDEAKEIVDTWMARWITI
jgi:monoamine oxidase